MKRYVSFSYFSRNYDVTGKFVLDQEEWDLLQELIENETEINFGEICGKHSDVFFTLKQKHFSIVTEDQDFLNKAKELGINLDSGHNPLDYYNDQEEDIEEEESEDEEYDD